MNKFLRELLDIQSPRVRGFAIKYATKIPEYFWRIPASLTGKHHPTYGLGEGGLYRHTQAALLIAENLFQMEAYNFSPRSKDLIRIALMFHDSYKTGIVESDRTVYEHPILAAKALFAESRELRLVDRIRVCGMILTHMGQWNLGKDRKPIMPKPFTKAQKFVHLCDYLASRKCIEINFETKE